MQSNRIWTFWLQQFTFTTRSYTRLLQNWRPLLRKHMKGKCRLDLKAKWTFAHFFTKKEVRNYFILWTNPIFDVLLLLLPSSEPQTSWKSALACQRSCYLAAVIEWNDCKVDFPCFRPSCSFLLFAKPYFQQNIQKRTEGTTPWIHASESQQTFPKQSERSKTSDHQFHQHHPSTWTHWWPLRASRHSNSHMAKFCEGQGWREIWSWIGQIGNETPHGNEFGSCCMEILSEIVHSLKVGSSYCAFFVIVG